MRVQRVWHTVRIFNPNRNIYIYIYIYIFKKKNFFLMLAVGMASYYITQSPHHLPQVVGGGWGERIKMLTSVSAFPNHLIVQVWLFGGWGGGGVGWEAQQLKQNISTKRLNIF